MCGIFFALKKQAQPLDQEIERSILRLLRHRGPDDYGILRFSNATLIHTRLSILDLDARSKQPFSSQNARWHIIYNGECYNFQALKQELAEKGVSFRTTSDTEVILAAFQEYGAEFITKINGIFSIIIYDKILNHVHIWRDRLGVKPLYWTSSTDAFYFSSEIKPLLLFTKSEVNENAYDSFFNLRYVVGEKTLFKNINEVSPGQYVLIQDFQRSEKKYWDILNFPPGQINVKEHSEELGHLLEDSIRIENIADVQVNCFLSGGIDSSLITAYSKKFNPHLMTFTLSTGLKNDETQKAQEVARYLEVGHQIIPVSPEINLYKKAIYHLEDPIGDSIILPTWQIAKAAADGQKVVLSGEGADEIFSGYVHQQILTIEDRVLSKIPASLIKIIPRIFEMMPLPLIEKLFPYPSQLGKSGRHKVLSHLNSLGDGIERVDTLISLFSTEESNQIFSQPFKRDFTRKDYWDGLGEMDFEDKLKRLDLRHWSSRYTLHRLDKLTMAHSLEARVPFFDHRLVEHMLKIRGKDSFSWRDPKRYLRRVVPKDLLPRKVIKRKKQAFFLPTQDVFSKKQLDLMEEQLLDNASKRGIFQKDKLERWIKNPNKELLYYKQLQVLMTFEWWSELFIDNDSTR